MRCVDTCGLVAQWLWCWIRDREVAGSTPSRSATKYQLWATCLHLRTCVVARFLMVGFNNWLSDYGSILTAGHLQTILSKLLTYCVLRPTQPFTLSGTRNDHVAYGLWVEGQ